jgi:hypothetical protein
MALVARNGIWLTRSTQFASDPFSPLAVQTPFGTDGLVQAIASGEMRLAAASNVQLYASLSNVLLGAQGTSNVLSVGSNAVTIFGDLRVHGTMDTVSSTLLHLNDKVVQVSVPGAPGDHVMVSEADLDGSGLAVAPGAYEKSVLWNAGAAFLRSSNTPYWQVRGGALRVVVPARSNAGLTEAGGETGFQLGINDNEEVELLKTWKDGAVGALHAQRIMTWGCEDAPASLEALLPKSTNPYGH